MCTLEEHTRKIEGLHVQDIVFGVRVVSDIHKILYLRWVNLLASALNALSLRSAAHLCVICALQNQLQHILQCSIN